MLQLNHLAIGYRKAILSDICLTAASGELVALVGRNGIGKSTLIRTISRLQRRLSGEIMLDSKPIETFSRSQLSEMLSIVSTETVGGLHLSVRQLVSFGRHPYTNWIGQLRDHDLALVDESMRLVGIEHLSDKLLYEISDGERQRAVIARSLAQDTPCILLDEPTAYLDMPNRYEVAHLLHRLAQERRKTIVFSTHDLQVAVQEADKLWLITETGAHEGTPKEMTQNGLLNMMFSGTDLRVELSGNILGIRHAKMPQE